LAIRRRPSGGSAGQKGMISIIEQLGTQDFPRLRIGIGKPPGRMDAAKYVLRDFKKNEQEVAYIAIKRAVEAVKSFVEIGIEATMDWYNGPT